MPGSNGVLQRSQIKVLGGCHLGRWQMELLIIKKYLGQRDA